jgi:flagellar motor switch protein FliN/FliY
MNDTTEKAVPETAAGGMQLEDFSADGQNTPGSGKADGENKDSVPNDQARPSTAEKAANLETILGISVTLSVELGRVRMSISELLHLNHGSVVELNRLAGSPMDILANGTLIAQGEVVVVNDRLGIRLTDVVSPTERIKGLK